MNSHGNLYDFNVELMLRERQEHEKRESFGKALELYQRAVQLNSNYAPAHFCRGVVLAKMGLWPDAASAYREAIRLQPEHKEAHANLGFVYYEMGFEAEAQTEFDCAIKLGGLARPAGKM